MSAAKPFKKKQVLVVDDDRALRHALSAMLDNAGFGLAAAADGVSGLTQIQHHHFDLVILDLGLPGIRGLDILSEIQTLESPPKVIIVTSDDTPATVYRRFGTMHINT